MRGSGVGPRVFQWTTEGRREVERLSGQKVVPVLAVDSGAVVVGSREIASWAEVNRVMPEPATSN